MKRTLDVVRRCIAIGRGARAWTALGIAASMLMLAGVAGPSRAQPQQPVSQPAPAPTGLALQVSITGFRNTTGQAVVALYTQSDGWLNLQRARYVQRLRITGRELFANFQGLQPGTYAVSVIHDENRNSRLDMNYIPFPSPAEGAGTSNNPRPTMGPPSWDDSRFELRQPRRLGIALRY